MGAPGHRDSVAIQPVSTSTSPLLIGLTGAPGCGSDTASEVLVAEHEFRQFAFTDPIREALLRLDPMLDRSTSLRMLVTELGWHGAREHRTYGPEVRRVHDAYAGVCRDMFGQDVWVRQLEARVVADANLHGPCPVVIRDVHLPIEAQWVLEHGGVVWKVARPAATPTGDQLAPDLIGPDLISETVLNDASPQAFRRRLDRALNDLIIGRSTPSPTTAVMA